MPQVNETELLDRWLAERTRHDRNGKVNVGDAFADFADFCTTLDQSSGSVNAFSRAMTARGVKRAPSKAVRRFTGFRLLPVMGEECSGDELPPDLLALI